MYYLSVRAPDGSSLWREVDQSALRVGRSANNDLVLSDPCVSRVHFEIIRRGDGCTVADLGSKAGTMVNSVPVKKAVRLKPGDRISAGKTLLTFQASSAPISSYSEVSTPSFDTAPYPTSEKGRPEGEGMPAETVHRAVDLTEGVLSLPRWPSLGRPVEEMLEKVMDLAGEAIPYDRGAVMLLNEEGEPVPVVRRPRDLELLSSYLSRAVISQVIGKSEAILLPDTSPGDLSWPDTTSGSAIRATLCVPFWSSQKLAGMIYLDSRDPRVHYGKHHLRDLAYLAGIAGAKLENSQLFAQMSRREQRIGEIREAARIQQHLLPARAPAIPGYRLDGSTFPCEEVGGDFYDFVALPGGRWGIVVADVAGHGLPAAILMSRFQAILSVLWESKRPLDRMVGRLNRLLCHRIPENRYLTLFCAVLDPREHRLTYVNAGHPSAWLLAPDGSDTPLPITGLFLGSFPEIALTSATLPMKPDSILVCPSDGVTEARNPGGEMFGESRLTHTARRHLGEAPADVIAHLTDEVDLHRSGAAQIDDMTLLVLTRGNECG